MKSLRRIFLRLLHRNCYRTIDGLRARLRHLRGAHAELWEEMDEMQDKYHSQLDADRRSLRNWESKYRRIAKLIGGVPEGVSLVEAVARYVQAAEFGPGATSYVVAHWDDFVRWHRQRTRNEAAKNGPVQ